MFAEPISVNATGTAADLRRVTMEKFRSGWGDPSDPVSLSIAHSFNGAEQSMVRIDLKKVIEDPIIPAQNAPVQASAWLVIRAPKNQLGFADADLKKLATGLTTLVNSTGFLDSLLRKES